MLASFVAGGVVMPGVHQLHHSHLEAQSETDGACDHDRHDIAFEEGHIEFQPDHCSVCTVSGSYDLLEVDTKSSIGDVDQHLGFSHGVETSGSALLLTIRGPPSKFLI